MNLQELRSTHADVLKLMRALLDRADGETRDLTTDEQDQYKMLTEQADGLVARIERAKDLEARETDIGRPATRAVKPGGSAAVLTHGRGDNEDKALRSYLGSGDRSGFAHLVRPDEQTGRPQIVFVVPTQRDTRMQLEQRAVVDSTMNITTAADGGALVPTTLVGQIALRKNELMLAEKLGCRRVPGSGTTVNYPYESDDPNAFAATAEQSDAHGNNYERAAFPTALKAFTLAKFTRKLELTEELIEDESAGLMDYVTDRISREIARTHNGLLFTQAAAGTSLKTFGSNAAIAAGELETIVGNDNLSFYLDTMQGVNWAMRSSTYWAIKSITGDARMYAGNETGLLGYPVHYSNQPAAIGAAAKSVFFGQWDYMGYREGTDLRFIQDPYTVDGMVVLKYSFRAVYGILQTAAIGYGVHP